ncbi:MAG: hypothetical protein H6739_22615 [Alphaproteobacteria bacterium]|nr:hypothetical protein [Alphaproteobacteria bacterium]
MFFLLLACGVGQPPPGTLAACPGLDCRRAWVEARWPEDPEAVTRAIAARSDPLERSLLVQAVAEAFPGQAGPLCDTLPAGLVAKRCARINQRPHLSAPAQDGGFLRLDAEPGAAEPWAGLEPRPVDCAHAALQATCQTEAALAATVAGALDEVAAACLAIEPGPWRDECFFAASEAWASDRPPEAVGDALRLCRRTGAFQGRCALHAVANVDRWTPPGAPGDPDAWAAVRQMAEAAEAALAPESPDLAERVVDRIHARALVLSYRDATEVAGDPLDALPPRAHPHVRAAAAWRLWQLEGRQARSFEAWAARFAEALAARRSPDWALPDERLPAPPAFEDLWIDDPPQPRVPYLDRPWRALHPDPTLDALICLLEAAARHTRLKGSRAVLVEAQAHPDPLVAATATRLLSKRSRPAWQAATAARPAASPGSPGSPPR